MWPRFGMKVANSSLCISYAKSDGSQDIIANKQGDRVSQACLFWDGEEIECGLTAKQKMATNPQQSVAYCFQLLVPENELPKCDKLKEVKKQFPSEYDEKENAFKLVLKPKPGEDGAPVSMNISPHKVLVELFRAELELAEQIKNDSDGELKPTVVIAVPSYYTESSYPLLATAAKDAGFHVAQIISEPAAALLAYDLIEMRSYNPRTVLTVKCGGLYTEVVLFSVCLGYLTEVKSFKPARIGGIDFTNELVRNICTEFQRKHHLNPHESRRSMAKIKNAANNCKHTLATMPSTQIYIDSVMDGYDFDMQISRARFEAYITPVINSIVDYVKKCVHDEYPQEIDDIVLYGGSMQIPKLRAAITNSFPMSKAHQEISADEVVAVGCAIQAGMLADPTKEQLDKSNRCIAAMEDLYFWHGDNPAVAKIIVNEGTVLPVTNKFRVAMRDNSNIFTLRAGTTTKQVAVDLGKDFEFDLTVDLQVEVSVKNVNGKITSNLKFTKI